MHEEIEDYLARPTDTLREVMVQLNRTSTQIALVVDAQRCLLGTLTDGDIRRALLSGCDIEAPASAAMHTEPRTVREDAEGSEIDAIFQSGFIRTIPVINEQKRVLGVHVLQDWPGHIAPRRVGLPAVVMAGGLGTRLRPLTDSTPKPLLPVGGKPILEHTIEHLSAAGIEEIVITTRYLAEQIEEFCGDGGKWDIGIDYLRERDRLGTAGALRHFKDRLKRPFLVMNGDLLTDFNVQSMLDFHLEQSAAMTVGVRHYSFQVPYGVAQVEGVHVKELVEKPTYDFFVNAGIYILEPWVISHIPPDEYYDITQLIDALIEQQQDVVSYPIYESWIDIGRPEDLARAHELMTPSNASR